MATIKKKIPKLYKNVIPCIAINSFGGEKFDTFCRTKQLNHFFCLYWVLSIFLDRIYREYYSSGHFICNLSNETSASLINFL